MLVGLHFCAFNRAVRRQTDRRRHDEKTALRFLSILYTGMKGQSRRREGRVEASKNQVEKWRANSFPCAGDLIVPLSSLLLAHHGVKGVTQRSDAA